MPSIRLAEQEVYYTHHKPAGGDSHRPPLLLVHGAGGHHLHWPPQLRRLPTTEVYALDLPGHGQSPGPGRTTIADYAQVVLAFADALALPPFILAGHSMGGAIALQLALTAGARLAGLILVGTGARLRVNAAILTGLQSTFAATTAQLIDWMYTPVFPPSQRERALVQLRTNDPQTVHDDFAACDAFDVRTQLSSLTLPTLIICGVADTMTPVKWSETLQQAIPGSQLHLIEAAGHMALIEQPLAVTEVIRRWLVSWLAVGEPTNYPHSISKLSKICETMAETLRLFVSATKDLEAERAIIGRSVAELPVKIGIEIRRTPVDGATYETMYELIGNCDRVYFLMGRDITAPAGAEWLIAWKLERSVMPLRLAGLPTPAGQDFMRLLPSGWQRFYNGAELARLVTLDLVDLLNHPKNRYGLTVTELELLNLHRQRIKQARIKTGGAPGGAEGGGVLLDEGHREPIMGVALDER